MLTKYRLIEQSYEKMISSKRVTKQLEAEFLILVKQLEWFNGTSELKNSENKI